MVSLLPTADPRLFHIEGGNAQIVERLLQYANASVALGTRITAVQRHANGSYSLQLATSHLSECRVRTALWWCTARADDLCTCVAGRPSA